MGSEQSKIIEVNGTQYDAVTGAVVRAAPSKHPRSSAQNIDGFFRARTTTLPPARAKSVSDVLAPTAAQAKPRTQAARTINHARAHTPQPTKLATSRVRSGVQHSQKLAVRRTPVNPNHVKHHGAQHSQTLMRTAVQPPAPSFHRQAGTQASLQHAVPSLIVPKKSAFSLDGTRLARAQDTPKNPLVAHHGAEPHTALKPVFTSLEVKPVPVKPEGRESANPPSPQPTNKPAENIFDHALANASNFVDLKTHRKHLKKQGRRHVLSMSAGMLALLIIVAFATYQNSAGLQFKVAGVKAGVATSMPNFKAAGFAYNGVKAGDGKLSIGFSGHGGNYQLTQASTNLSSSDLVHNLAATDASGAPNYHTVSAGGTTIYRFSNTDASWVSDGTSYTVNGTGSLTDAQVKALVQNI